MRETEPLLRPLWDFSFRRSSERFARRMRPVRLVSVASVQAGTTHVYDDRRGHMDSGEPRIRVFVSYSHHDRDFVGELIDHLAVLRNQGILETWTDREIPPGTEWNHAIDENLQHAEIVVLLISSSFLASDYCYRVEVARAMERHSNGECIVVPIVVRACNWAGAPFETLQVLPSGARAVALWEDRDEAWSDVEQGLRRVLADLRLRSREPPATSALEQAATIINGRSAREAFTATIAAQMRAIRQERSALLRAAADTAAIDERLLQLKRILRTGPLLRAGDCLGGRYELLEPIGSGGFATVWRAYDEHTEDIVALKVLHAQYGDDSTRRDRFFRGAREMAKLAHPNIVRVIDTGGEDDGFYYFAMEHVQGKDFRRLVTGREIDGSNIAPIILLISRALEYAHDHGVVHRDVKPSNILIAVTGRPKLTDFDLARVAQSTGGTRTGAMGSFLYAAPEALNSAKDVDARADVFSLGMTAAFGLHGEELPFDAFRDIQAFAQKLQCSTEMRNVLLRATHWDASKRFTDVREFRAALERAISTGSGEHDENPAERILHIEAGLSTTVGRRLWPRADSEPGRRARLRAVDGQDLVAIYWLTEICLLGRALDCAVRVRDLNVSRRHARITHVGDRYMIEDLCSGNGTFVNNASITRYYLSHLDVIRIGDSSFVFEEI